MEYLMMLSLILLSLFTYISLTNILFGPYLRSRVQLSHTPFVSIMIPARNEEANIARCLDSLLQQNYDKYEILVLDDNSEDRTGQIILHYVRKHTHIRYLEGMPLPEGWLGKNWACWQLSKHAGGEILIFVDADTWHANSAILATISWIEKYSLGLFSAFPRQILKTVPEKLVVPIIDIILYTLLPLWTTYAFKSPSLAAANGQWLAMTRDAYRKIGGHERVKDNVVEDVELARLAKTFKFKTIASAGTGMVFCRMYDSFNAIWRGLTKNLYGLTGKNVLVLFALLSIMILVYIVPYILLILGSNYPLIITILAILLVMRAMLAMAYRHPFIISVMFIPVTMIIGIIIAINSFFQSNWGSITWKDRKINLKNS